MLNLPWFEVAVGILTLAQQYVDMELKVSSGPVVGVWSECLVEAAVGILTLAQQHLHMQLKVRLGLVVNLGSEYLV